MRVRLVAQREGGGRRRAGSGPAGEGAVRGSCEDSRRHRWLPESDIGDRCKKPQVPGCALRPAVSLVGVTGFEPATSSSRTKRATKLRHTPLQRFLKNLR